jgi:hypothetical protein
MHYSQRGQIRLDEYGKYKDYPDDWIIGLSFRNKTMFNTFTAVEKEISCG